MRLQYQLSRISLKSGYGTKNGNFPFMQAIFNVGIRIFYTKHTLPPSDFGETMSPATHTFVVLRLGPFAADWAESPVIYIQEFTRCENSK